MAGVVVAVASQRASTRLRPDASITVTQWHRGRVTVVWFRMGHLLFICCSPMLADPHWHTTRTVDVRENSPPGTTG